MEGGKGSSSIGRTPSAYVLEGEHAEVRRIGKLASSARSNAQTASMRGWILCAAHQLVASERSLSSISRSASGRTRLPRAWAMPYLPNTTPADGTSRQRVGRLVQCSEWQVAISRHRTHDMGDRCGGNAGGHVECRGTPTKSLSVGNAARNGLWSALLAECGFSGPPAPIEGRQGYLSALAPSTIDWPALTSGLGDT
jgi:MmgE/PrpD N-terminal domain